MNNICTKILDCWPDKAQYFEGQSVTILTEIDEWDSEINLILTVSKLNEKQKSFPINTVKQNKNGIYLAVTEIGSFSCGGYGVDILYGENCISTAFDVVHDKTDDIRYGFLTDFSEKDNDISDINFVEKLHLNAIQFYDWMYRHDNLVSKVNNYKDPIGRDMSLPVIRKKINACKQNGIRPFAYGAIYAANKDLYKKHPEWALYKLDGEPMIFADWLVYMNTSKDSPWSNYIVDQYSQAIKELGFQGIHMDTYGFPKKVWNYYQKEIALEDTFSELIYSAKNTICKADSQAGVIFNAVNNWPIEAVADSKQDAVYIEVWPPHDTYYNLYTLIREAKLLTRKTVILAAYMKPFQGAENEEQKLAAENALLLANAVISASGGHQLVFGENSGVLCDSYYVNYAVMRESFIPKVRAYCDFVVRYSELLYEKALDISMTAANGINEDIKFFAGDSNIKFSSNGQSGKVWTLIRESSKYLVIQMINLVGIDNKWNEPKKHNPEKVTDICVEMLVDRPIRGAWLVSPDFEDCRPQKINYRTEQRSNGQYIIADISNLDIWNMIWVETI